MDCIFSRDYKTVEMLSSSATEKCSHCHQDIANSDPDEATAILGTNSGCDGWDTLFPLSITAMLANHGHLWDHAYRMRRTVLSCVFTVCYAAPWRRMCSSLKWCGRVALHALKAARLSFRPGSCHVPCDREMVFGGSELTRTKLGRKFHPTLTDYWHYVVLVMPCMTVVFSVNTFTASTKYTNFSQFLWFVCAPMLPYVILRS